MSVLADPGNSQLLLINPTPEYISQLDGGISEQILDQFQRLSAVADHAGVPRYFAVSQSTNDQGAWLSIPCKKNKSRVFKFDYGKPIWANAEMLLAMQSEGREQLFVCGFWLDDVVTAAALEAQSLGFNTHVIVDLSLSYNHRTRQPSLDRFNQYGIVPISLQNLLYEWMTKVDNEACRKDLEKFWNEQKFFD